MNVQLPLEVNHYRGPFYAIRNQLFWEGLRVLLENISEKTSRRPRNADLRQVREKVLERFTAA